MNLNSKNKIKLLVGFLFINLILAGCTFRPVLKNTIKQIDVHLVASNSVTNQIKSFNKFLSKKGLLKKYNITPFLVNYPVHLTLYLTDFNIKNLEKIKKNILSIAKSNNKFKLSTSGIVASKSGFVLLNVDNVPGEHGKLNTLQLLSNQVISLLEKYRDKNAAMPEWVKYFPLKIVSFKKYGTPNAYTQFSPHFSILAVSLKNKKLKNSFIKDMNQAIKGFKFKPVKATVNAIGIGEVNKDGQIIKEIKTLPLK